jgi:hypothetical protein
MEVNGAYTISAEESKKLNEEYLINNCIYYLIKARAIVGGDKTINTAIEELKTKTRFAGELENLYEKSLASIAQDFLNPFDA